MTVFSKLIRSINYHGKTKKPQTTLKSCKVCSLKLNGLIIKGKLLLPLVAIPDSQPAMALFRAGGCERRKGKSVATLNFSKQWVFLTTKNQEQSVKNCTTTIKLEYENIVSVDITERKNEVAIVCKRPVESNSYWCVCLKLKTAKGFHKGKLSKNRKITGNEILQLLQPSLRTSSSLPTACVPPKDEPLVSTSSVSDIAELSEPEQDHTTSENHATVSSNEVEPIASQGLEGTELVDPLEVSDAEQEPQGLEETELVDPLEVSDAEQEPIASQGLEGTELVDPLEVSDAEQEPIASQGLEGTELVDPLEVSDAEQEPIASQGLEGTELVDPLEVSDAEQEPIASQGLEETELVDPLEVSDAEQEPIASQGLEETELVDPQEVSDAEQEPIAFQGLEETEMVDPLDVSDAEQEPIASQGLEETEMVDPLKVFDAEQDPIASQGLEETELVDPLGVSDAEQESASRDLQGSKQDENNREILDHVTIHEYASCPSIYMEPCEVDCGPTENECGPSKRHLSREVTLANALQIFDEASHTENRNYSAGYLQQTQQTVQQASAFPYSQSTTYGYDNAAQYSSTAMSDYGNAYLTYLWLQYTFSLCPPTHEADSNTEPEACIRNNYLQGRVFQPTVLERSPESAFGLDHSPAFCCVGEQYKTSPHILYADQNQSSMNPQAPPDIIEIESDC